MEGMRDVALANYETLPDEKKTKIQSDFKRTVEERNVSEYFIFTCDFKSETVEECLKACEEYEEGRLDFNNFITLRYIMENVYVGKCNECSSLILGKLFFSCYECFMDSDVDSFELCCGCYGSKKFKGHKHVKFFDSQTLYFLSTRMLARKKRDLEERNMVIEMMMIDFACDFLKKARSIKTEKPWTKNFHHRLFNFDKNKKLGEISRLAKELKENPNGEEETIESSDEEDHEDSEDEEDSTTFSRGDPRRIDLFGAEPSWELVHRK